MLKMLPLAALLVLLIACVPTTEHSDSSNETSITRTKDTIITEETSQFIGTSLRYFDSTAREWRDADDACEACTPENGYVVMDAFYFDPANRVWRDIETQTPCFFCTPETGFPTPEGLELADNLRYYDLATDTWKDREGVCNACTPENGFLVQDGYYFNPTTGLWYGPDSHVPCLECTAETGFPRPGNAQ